ncbi:MAG: beta-lactamase family protein, partial [Lentisphaeria bacterium]|nr:beta-lactamase family protein [Lentisphaeria bacterium]
MDLQKAVQQVLDRAVENGTECGCQAALYIDGELAVNAYAGWTDWSRTQKVDENTVFPVYSTGKAMSSTLIHRLVEMGKVNYDTKIADFWPEFGCNGKEDMRVWHVLAYRAALSSIPETEIIP